MRVSRYIDLFTKSEETPEAFAKSLEQILGRRLQRVTDRGEDVLYLYSGAYKWFDVGAGVLDRHPDYGFQVYIGRGHHDVGDRLRVNFAWSILEKLAPCYPLIFEDNLSGIQIINRPGQPLPSAQFSTLVQAGAGEVATIFTASPEPPPVFVHSLSRILTMEAHSSTRSHSPVLAVMVGEAVRLRVEEHDYEDTAGLHVSTYRYCIDLDPLDAAGVFERMRAAGRYRLLWVKNLAETVTVYEP